jgi:hypothetical protein
MDSEEAARKQGWTPQDEFRGDPEKWVDAETFVERGEKIAGIATSRNKKLEEVVDTLNAKVAKLEATNHEFGEFHRQSLDKAQRDHETEIQELRNKQAEAVENGDGQAFLKIGDDIKAAERAPAKQQEWAKDWASQNEWYARDAVMRSVADTIAESLRIQQPNLEGHAFLDKVSELTKVEMPHKFENPNRNTSVTAGTSKSDETAAPSERSFEALPDEVKLQCDSFIAEGIIKDRKSYLKDYTWE